MLHSSRRSWFSLLTAATLLLAGNGAPSRAVTPSAQAALNDGYSLFYDFCSQESQLSLLLWVKSTPPAIADYAKRISSTAKDDMALLTKMGAADSDLRLNKTPLPGFEINVRKSMSDDRKQQLIFGTTGAAFAQAMTITQSETTNYGLHVAKVLAETEPDPARAHALHQMYETWLALHNEAYRLSR